MRKIVSLMTLTWMNKIIHFESHVQATKLGMLPKATTAFLPADEPKQGKPFHPIKVKKKNADMETGYRLTK